MKNDTKIKYIKVLDKLYEVERISFFTFTVEAKETELTINDVPEQEVFDLSNFEEFKVRLNNWQGNVIDLIEYVKIRKMES